MGIGGALKRSRTSPFKEGDDKNVAKEQMEKFGQKEDAIEVTLRGNCKGSRKISKKR